MSIFLVNFLLIFFYAVILKPNQSKINKKKFLWLVGLQLVLISGIRNITVGWDTANYAKEWARIADAPWNEVFRNWMEPGYVLLNKISSCIFFNFTFFLFVIALVTIALLFRFIFIYSPDAIMSVFLFITFNSYYDTMNIMRQMLAVSISTLAVDFLFHKKYFLGLAIFGISCMFHKSLFFLLPFILFIVFIKKCTLKLIFIIYLGAIAISLGFNFVLKVVLKIFPFYNQYFEGILSKQVKDGKLNMFLIFSCILLLGIILKNSFCSLERKKFESNSENPPLLDESHCLVWKDALIKYDIGSRAYNMFLCASLFSSAIYAISINLSLITRFGVIFSIYNIFMVPYALSAIKSKKQRIFVKIIIVLVMLMYAYLLLYHAEGGLGRSRVLPYYTVWQNKGNIV